MALKASGEAPVHAAVLVRLCGAASAGITGTAAIGLAQQARHVLSESAGLLAWLDGRTDTLPDACRPAAEADAEAAARLREALAATGLEVRGLGAGLGVEASLLAALHACGLTTPERMEIAFVLARLPCAVAEALAHSPGRFDEYPMNLPPFEEQTGERTRGE